MIKQLEDSMDFDCGTQYYNDNVPVLLSPEEYRTQELVAATRELDHAKERREEEIQRSCERNEWLQQLFASLGLEFEDES